MCNCCVGDYERVTRRSALAVGAGLGPVSALALAGPACVRYSSAPSPRSLLRNVGAPWARAGGVERCATAPCQKSADASQPGYAVGGCAPRRAAEVACACALLRAGHLIQRCGVRAPLLATFEVPGSASAAPLSARGCRRRLRGAAHRGADGVHVAAGGARRAGAPGLVLRNLHARWAAEVCAQDRAALRAVRGRGLHRGAAGQRRRGGPAVRARARRAPLRRAARVPARARQPAQRLDVLRRLPLGVALSAARRAVGGALPRSTRFTLVLDSPPTRRDGGTS